MKKHSSMLVLLALWLLPSALSAAPVSQFAARQKAQSFLQERGLNTVSAADLQTVSTLPHAINGRRMKAGPTDESSYYVFNIPQESGFVIVSGDDRTPAILGYADSGSFTPDDMPPAMQWLLEGYEEQIAWLDTNGQQQLPYKAPARTPIAPMIKTHWYQDKPYNNLCPEISYTDGEETKTERAVTGCVATAMAQVMYYHQWPTGETSGVIPGYTTRNGLATLNELPVTTFDWNAMTTTYSSSDTGAAADAVAKLMQYCGWALQMDYNRSSVGSSAYNLSIGETLKKYFGYDSGVQLLRRSYCSYQEWVAILYSELAQRRPVVLGGQSADGGHSFVCDGYQGDDYFHINWGWGGSSDGYYRLSALNPREQGIGGSSSLDGFSFSQDAIIGIQKGNESQTTLCLSLEGQRFGKTDYSKTKTYTRESTDQNFTGIGLYLVLCSYQFDPTKYDYSVQLVNENGTLIQTMATVTEVERKIFTDFYPTWNNLQIESDIDDGTYYIKVVSRTTGATPWVDCYAASQYQMTAVINGNTLTITAPKAASALPSDATISVSGNLTQGYEQTVTASITGGSADYHGDVILRVNGTAVMGKTLDIPAGQIVDATFKYTPTTADDNVLKLYNKKEGGTQIGQSTTVDINESDATNTQYITVAPFIENLNNDKLYGNALCVKVTVGNPSATNSYASKLNCSLRTYANNTDEDDAFISSNVQSTNIAIDKNSTTEVTFKYSGLEKGKFYCLRLSYEQGYEENGEKKKRLVSFLTERYEMGEGYLVYYPDNSFSMHEKGEPADVSNAVCIDLSSISNLAETDISLSSNPNCLYLLADGADTPQGLSGCNVVSGNTASSITLTDGHDFYSPIDFTATSICYTRTFTRPATGTGGWNTLCLPFTVETVTAAPASGNSPAGTIDWFHSDSDTGKNFWLKTMTGDDNGTLFFGHADALTANTPYIIALPGEDFGTDWQLTGKAITFSATDAAVSATATGALTGNSFKFCGSTVGSSHQDVYMLNTAGNRFIKATRATTLPAFRTWIEPVSISSLSRQQLVIGDEGIQGIHNLTTGNKPIGNAAVYTLSGQKTTMGKSQKGIYISNGKKIIVK